MKKIVNLLLVVCGFVMLSGLSGCSTMYGNEAQYDKGDWYFFGGSEEVARIKQDKLAIKKLESQPVQTASVDGVAQGYKGKVASANRNLVNIIIRGPETKSFMLGPGKSEEEDYLTPGNYTATTYVGGRQLGYPWPFTVGVQQNKFLGKDYHWYVYQP